MFKKVLLSIISLGLLVGSTFAYTLNSTDKILVQKLTQKVEDLIESKGESFRGKFIKVLNTYAIKYKSEKPRYAEIFLGVAENLEDLEDEDIENLLDETGDSSGILFQNDKFSYECPKGRNLGPNRNYNGEVEISECSKIYSSAGMSFDDGISFSIGYIPSEVVNKQKEYSLKLIDSVKNEDNAQQYFGLNNDRNFSGRMSMKKEHIHTFSLIARKHENGGGYYEVTVLAMGDSKTDEEFKEMAENILSTFREK